MFLGCAPQDCEYSRLRGIVSLQSLRAIARAATAGTGDDVLFEHIDTRQINGFRGQFFVPDTDGVPTFHVFSPPFC
jgi:hypothetical protein